MKSCQSYELANRILIYSGRTLITCGHRKKHEFMMHERFLHEPHETFRDDFIASREAATTSWLAVAGNTR